jgi:hypothetical protein
VNLNALALLLSIVTVWVNTRSGVYHYPGTRWYGNTKSGPKALFPCGRLSEQSLIAFYEPSEIAGLEGSDDYSQLPEETMKTEQKNSDDPQNDAGQGREAAAGETI